MAQADQIITEISIVGQEDVIAALKGIGEAGASAFSAIEKALIDSSAVIAGIVAAVGGIGVALEEWARSSARATVEMDNLAKASGLTIEQMSALKGTLEGLGADSGFLESAFRRTAIIIENTWSEIAKSVKGARDQIVNDQLAIQQSTLGVESAENAVFNARAKLAAIKGNPFSPEILARQQIKEAIQAQEQAELALAQAQQKEKEAADKATENRRNSIESVTAAVNSIVSGMQNVGSASADANLEIGNVVKGLIAGAGPAGESAAAGLKTFSGSMEDISSQAPEVQAVFFNLADFMKNSGNQSLNTALAYRFFGRNLRQDVIQALSEGSEAIKKNMKDLEDLGIVLKDKKPADDFQKAFGSVSFTIRTTLQQIGNLFAPVFTEGFNRLNEFIKTNHQAILKWAGDIANNVTPIINAFFKLISGIELKGKSAGGEDPDWIVTLIKAGKKVIDFFNNEIFPAIGDFFRALAGKEIETPWVQKVVDAVQGLLDFLGTAIDVVGAIGTALNAAFGGLADVINLLAGSDLKGAEVALFSIGAAAVALLAGLHPAIAAIIAITAAITALQAVINKSTDNEMKSLALEINAMVEQRKAMVKAIADTGSIDDDKRKELEQSIVDFRSGIAQAVATRDRQGIIQLRETITEMNRELFDLNRDAANKGADEWGKANEKIGKSAREQAKLVREEWAKIKAEADAVGKPKAGPDGVTAGEGPGKKLADDLEKARTKADEVRTGIENIKTGRPDIDTELIDGKFVKLKKDAEDTGKAIKEGLAKGGREAAEEMAKTFALVDGKLVTIAKDISQEDAKKGKARGFGVRTVGDEKGFRVGKTEEETVDGLQKKIEKLKETSLDLEKQLVDGLDKGLDMSRIKFQIDDIAKVVDNLTSQLDKKVADKGKALTDADKEKLSPLEEPVKVPAPDVSEFKTGLDNIDSDQRSLLEKITESWKPSPINPSLWEIPNLKDEFKKDLDQKYADIQRMWGENPIKTEAWTVGTAPVDSAVEIINADYQKIKTTWGPAPMDTAAWASSTQGGFEEIVNQGQTAYDRLVEIFKQPLSINAEGGGFGGIFSGGGFAEGGLFRGAPGIDTNWAKLSDFEWIMNPFATKGWGTQFMSMVNDMDFNGVARWMSGHLKGFAGGGLNLSREAFFPSVSSPLSSQSAMSSSREGSTEHVTVDLRTDKGTFKVLAPQSTVRELMRYSVEKSYTSAGRKPSWVT